MSESYLVREARPADLDAILEIEKGSFSDPYPRGLLKAFLYHPGAYVVALSGDTLVGYVIGILRRDQGHIVSIAVRKDYRRCGVGQKLMREAIEILQHTGAESIRLEVRQSNLAAIRLYEKLGFVERERIKGYYPDGETAIVMFLKCVEGKTAG